jgi:hypothetical protein
MVEWPCLRAEGREAVHAESNSCSNTVVSAIAFIDHANQDRGMPSLGQPQMFSSVQPSLATRRSARAERRSSLAALTLPAERKGRAQPPGERLVVLSHLAQVHGDRCA